MSDAGFLMQAIFSNQMKEYSSLNIAYTTSELTRLERKVENLQDKKSEYEEVKSYLMGEDKDDTVQYRMVEAEIKELTRQIKNLEDEETDLNFLKQQEEAMSQTYASQASSFTTAANDAIRNSYSLS